MGHSLLILDLGRALGPRSRNLPIYLRVHKDPQGWKLPTKGERQGFMVQYTNKPHKVCNPKSSWMDQNIQKTRKTSISTLKNVEGAINRWESIRKFWKIERRRNKLTKQQQTQRSHLQTLHPPCSKLASSTQVPSREERGQTRATPEGWG